MKVAVAHDYLDQFGGAERVVYAIHEIFPTAPIYTSIYNKDNFPDEYQKLDIKTSFMQTLPFVFKNFRAFIYFYPFAFRSFDLSQYDLIISSSSAFAKGIKKRNNAVHICYCHNPMRFVWRYDEYVEKTGLPGFIKNILPLLLWPLRVWDMQSSRKVDYFIANSQEVSNRIKSIYNRDSVIIYPPIDVNSFNITSINKDYYLVVSRLLHYKRIDLAVSAFSKIKKPLKIAGDGPALRALKKIAGPNVEFLGNVSESELKKLYSECKALILPGEEDFGMTPLEAAASGRPTIAYAKGGALETIVDQKTGVLFKEQTEESLINAINGFERLKFDKDALNAHAKKFDKEIFKQKIRRMLDENKIF